MRNSLVDLFVLLLDLTFINMNFAKWICNLQLKPPMKIFVECVGYDFHKDKYIYINMSKERSGRMKKVY